MGQYNFKTTDKDIIDYLDKQDNVSKTIKEAIKIMQLNELNPQKVMEKPKLLTNLELEL